MATSILYLAKASALAIVILAAGGTAPAVADGGWSPFHVFDGVFGVSGSGDVRREVREVAAFDAVKLLNSVDLEVRIGSPQSLVIEGDSNILPLITTEVGAGTLTIGSNSSYRTRHRLRIQITVPALQALAIRGSGDARLHQFSGDTLALSISGSGDIRADGEVGRIVLRIDGSGDADLAALRAREAKVTINGSGDARLQVTESLVAGINGSGDIRYTGKPAHVATERHGSGDISSY